LLGVGVAREGVLDGLGGVANGLLCLAEDGLALVTAGAGGVTDGLASRLVGVYETLLAELNEVKVSWRHTGLDSASSAVEATGDRLLGLVEGGLGGVRLDLLLGLGAEVLASKIRHVD
jgi:hypothetical protein